MNEFQIMFRAFGYDGQDNIVHFHTPRDTYEGAESDLDAVMAIDGVNSAAIEKRLVRNDVVLVSAETVPEAPNATPPAGDAKAAGKAAKD